MTMATVRSCARSCACVRMYVYVCVRVCMYVRVGLYVRVWLAWVCYYYMVVFHKTFLVPICMTQCVHFVYVCVCVWF